MLTIFEVAKIFLSFSAMTHKKLQKLCYYAYAWHMALEDTLLFSSHFEAWVHGSVSPELYSRYVGFCFNEIPQEVSLDKKLIKHDKMDFLKHIYRIYGKMTGDQLECLICKETPYIQARGNLEIWEPCRTKINDDVIKTFYLDEFQKDQHD